MKILILPIDRATRYQPNPQEITSMIRILEPDSESQRLEYEHSFKEVLELSFHDVYKTKTRKLMPSNIHFFSETDAKNLLKFFQNNKKIDTLVIHCFAGVSRSPAVALGFSWFLQNEELEKDILESGKFVPNPLVLTIMSQVLDIYEAKRPLIESYTNDEDEEEFDWNDY